MRQKLQNPQGFGDVPTKEDSSLMWMQLDGMKIQGPYFLCCRRPSTSVNKSSEKSRKLMIFSLNKVIFLKMCFVHCMYSPQIFYVHVFNSSPWECSSFFFFFPLPLFACQVQRCSTICWYATLSLAATRITTLSEPEGELEIATWGGKGIFSGSCNIVSCRIYEVFSPKTSTSLSHSSIYIHTSLLPLRHL